MGGIPAALMEKLIGPLFDSGEGEVKPLQTAAAKGLDFETAMLEKFLKLKEIYSQTPEQTGTFFGQDPLDPGGPVKLPLGLDKVIKPLGVKIPSGWGVDAGPWVDELGEQHKQGGFDKWMMEMARGDGGKGDPSKAREDLTNAVNSINEDLYKLSGASVKDQEAQKINPLAPVLNQSKQANINKVNLAIEHFRNKQKNSGNRLKAVHPGTDSTIDQFMRVDSLF